MFMSHPGLATCLWKTVRESNKKLSTLVVFPSPLLTLISQYRNAWMCFHGKLADLTSEGFLKGAQGFLSQARQKGHVRFLCFTWCKKRLKKNFSLQTAMSSWACPPELPSQHWQATLFCRPCLHRRRLTDHLSSRVWLQYPTSNYNNYLNVKAILDSITSCI